MSSLRSEPSCLREEDEALTCFSCCKLESSRARSYQKHNGKYNIIMKYPP